MYFKIWEKLFSWEIKSFASVTEVMQTLAATFVEIQYLHIQLNNWNKGKAKKIVKSLRGSQRLREPTPLCKRGEDFVQQDHTQQFQLMSCLRLQRNKKNQKKR